MNENLKIFLFAAVFMVTLGIVAIGILLSYSLQRTGRKPYLQTLLYQQIFTFSFFLYGAWGRILLGQAFLRMELSERVISKISFFIPVMGLPFIIIGWYMLIKFFYEVQGRSISRKGSVFYFLFFGILITCGIWFINTRTFEQMENPEVTFINLLSGVNVLANLFILIPLIQPPFKPGIQILFSRLRAMGYLAGVLCYSAGLWFIKDHDLIAASTLLFMFAVNALIPVFVHLEIKNTPGSPTGDELDFETFCQKFEISKREAEIILEICSGKSNQDIADKLFITLQTVKDHAHRIYTKTGVKNRVHLTNLVREKIKGKRQ